MDSAAAQQVQQLKQPVHGQIKPSPPWLARPPPRRPGPRPPSLRRTPATGDCPHVERFWVAGNETHSCRPACESVIPRYVSVCRCLTNDEVIPGEDDWFPAGSDLRLYNYDCQFWHKGQPPPLEPHLQAKAMKWPVPPQWEAKREGAGASREGGARPTPATGAVGTGAAATARESPGRACSTLRADDAAPASGE